MKSIYDDLMFETELLIIGDDLPLASTTSDTMVVLVISRVEKIMWTFDLSDLILWCKFVNTDTLCQNMIFFGSQNFGIDDTAWQHTSTYQHCFPFSSFGDTNSTMTDFVDMEMI